MVTGSKRFDIFREGTDCNTVKKLVQCATNNTFYVADELVYIATQIEIGDVFSAYITNADGQQLLCLRYDSDVSGSPDSYIDSITGIHSTCGICNTDIQPSPSPSPSLTATPTLTPTNTPTSSVTASVTPTASLSPTPGVSATSTPRPTLTPSVTPTLTRTQTVTPTPTHTPTVTQSITPSVTASNTPTNTVTPSNTPTITQSMTPSITPTYTPTVSPSDTPGSSSTPTPTASETPAVTPTNTPTVSLSDTPPVSQTPTPTASETPAVTPTNTPSVSVSDTPGVSQTPTPTISRTPDSTPTNTPTVSLSDTPPVSQTPTPTASETPAVTPTNTPTVSLSDTPPVSQTPTPTISRSPDYTPTHTPTPSATTPCCTNWLLYGGTRGAQFEIQDCGKLTYSLFVNGRESINVCAVSADIVSGDGANVYADPGCVCLSPTPTPTQSQTPTPTHTPTQTPTNTQTQTPTPTLTPSVTASITPSTSGGVPSQTHVYSACTTEIAIIVSQNVPVPNVSVGQTFQYQGVCYIYVGTFNQPYVPPQGFIYSNSSTNIFGSPTVFSDCPTCNTNLNAATPTPSPMTCSLTVFNPGPITHPCWCVPGATLNDYKTKIENFNFYSPAIASYSENQNTGGSSSFTVNGNITFGKSFTNNSLYSYTIDSTITVGDVYAVKMCANDLNNTVTWSVPSTSANQILTFEARDPQNQWLTGQGFVFSATTNSTVTTSNGKTFYYFEAECTSATTQVNSSREFTDNTNVTWSGEFCLTQSTIGPQYTQWNVQRSVSINCPNCTLFGPLSVIYTYSSVNALASGVVVYNNSALTTYVTNGTFISDGSTIYSVGPNGVLTLQCQVGLGC